MKIIILAGGSGMRLWPLSTPALPKQFLHFDGEKTLLQKTLLRFLKGFDAHDIFIVTQQEYYSLVIQQVEEIDPLLQQQILLEPKKKNTAPALALAVKLLQERFEVDEEECILVSPADHFIPPEETFLEKIKKAEKTAIEGKHVIFGVRPHKPETGYGYIHFQEGIEECLEVKEFKEKPDLETAKKYLLSGEYFWNCGLFLFQIKSLIEDLNIHCPTIAYHLHDRFQEMVANFDAMPTISIDYALMEKSARIRVMPLDLFWSDVGSWESLYEVLDKDEAQNVSFGNVVTIDSKNCFVKGDKKLIALIGVENMVIVDTEEALLITKKDQSQKLKQLTEELLHV